MSRAVLAPQASATSRDRFAWRKRARHGGKCLKHDTVTVIDLPSNVSVREYSQNHGRLPRCTAPQRLRFSFVPALDRTVVVLL